MANYRSILRHFPAGQDYLQQRKWVRRGDVLAYAPNACTPSFSTDALGFRHTSFGGRDVGVADIEAFEQIGLILGSSHPISSASRSTGTARLCHRTCRSISATLPSVSSTPRRTRGRFMQPCCGCCANLQTASHR